MKKIQNILLPTDFSESAQHALISALIIADKTAASIHVLHIVQPQGEPFDIPIPSPATQNTLEIARELIAGFVDLGKVDMEKILKNKPSITTEVKIGSPTRSILKTIIKQNFDLVVMGAKGKHNVIEKAFGTVSAAVVKRAACPVMIIPEKSDILPKFQTLAFATNLNDADPYEIWKTINLIDLKESILRVVHISKPGDNIDEKVELTNMQEFFKEHAPVLQLQFHQLAGHNVEAELIEFINTYDVDLMIMFQPDRGFLENIFHRSHTKQLAGKSNVPVLVMKE